MDIGGLIGIGGAFGLILLGIILGGSSITGFIDAPSLVIVGGGTVLAMLAAFPISRVKELLTVVKKALATTDFDPVAAIDQLVQMCTVVRREGLLALDSMVPEMDDPFLAKGAQFVVDGTDPEMTRVVLETDLGNKRQRHAKATGMVEFGATIAPAFGMIGTLIGLVGMLADLNPNTLGPKMAVALLTTFYGSVLANVVFTPLATRLKDASADEALVNTIMIEGLLGIQAGENPRNLEDKLKAFLPVPMRSKVGEEAGEGMSAAA